MVVKKYRKRGKKEKRQEFRKIAAGREFQSLAVVGRKVTVRGWGYQF